MYMSVLLLLQMYSTSSTVQSQTELVFFFNRLFKICAYNTYWCRFFLLTEPLLAFCKILGSKGTFFCLNSQIPLFRQAHWKPATRSAFLFQHSACTFPMVRELAYTFKNQSLRQKHASCVSFYTTGIWCMMFEVLMVVNNTVVWQKSTDIAEYAVTSVYHDVL